MNKRLRTLLPISIIVFGSAYAAVAQPAMSRGQQILAITYDECLRRAQAAFSAEGWGNIGTSGNAVAGFKGINGSYIVCNPVADNNVAVNIFVASSSSDSNVPGAERVRLQQRMSGQSSSAPGSIEGKWCRVGSGRPTAISVSGDSITFTNEFGSSSRGRFDGPDGVIATDWAGGLRGTLNRERTRIDWANNTQWQRCN